MRLIIRKTLLMFLLLSLSNVLTGFQLSAQEQNKKFSVKADNVTLKEAIEVVRKQGNYSFLIRNNDIDLNKKVSVNVDKGTINDVMAQLLTGTGISYEVNGNRVVIFHAAVPEKEQGKAFVLKGKVTDPSGEGVIGANVKVLNSTEGTITDMDGNFSLSVTPNARLSVSYIGYATQEVVVKNQTPLHIALKEDSRLIDEVVVVGYGVQKKANLTGAVSSVKMDEVLGDRPVVSVSDALKGAMPGLQITGNSGRPGEEMSFNIRGVNSLDKNGKPLVLVDNVEMDINMLDPNDIESVTVLKDAASSAIYGARAAFGVILITTKKGSDSTRLSINYSNNFSFSRPANMPRKATPLQTVQAYKDMGTINYQSGQNVDTWLDLLKEYNANPSAYPDGYAMVDGLRYSLAETNLFDDMMETGFQQTHNLSVGGGTKDISYRFSFGMVDENGVLASDKDAYKRYNVSSYIRSDVFSWITPELDIKYTNSKSELPETSGGYGIWGAAVAFPSYFPIGTMNIDGEELPINTPRNLINLAYPTTIQKNNIRIFGKVTITPLKNVKLVGEYTYNHLSNEKTKFEKKFYYAHGGNFVKETSTANSKYENSNGITDYNALNFYGNYNNTWGKHEVTVMGGFNQESSDYRYAEMSRMNMINEDLPSISQATGDYFAKDKFERYTVRGLFYRINYSFAGKYLIETNGRYDGSSKFPKDSRFGFFPSVSAGWRVSEEAFMKPLTSVLSNLKLRASWGNIGNLLEVYPKGQQTEATVFTTYDNFKTYAWGLYNVFFGYTYDTGQTDEIFRGDFESDNMIKGLSGYEGQWAYQKAKATDEAKEWDYDYIRRVNLMLDNIDGSQMNDTEKEHWRSVGYFFRSYKYFQMLSRFGDIPWVENALKEDSPELYGKRDNRDLVASNILSNLKYAETHIGADDGKNTIGISVVQALISRFALFEGTWRKYHGLSDAETYLKECVRASEEVLKVYPNVHPQYDELFNSESLDGVTGIILYKAYETGQLMHGLTRMVRTGESYIEATKDAVDSYLCTDGRPVSTTTSRYGGDKEIYGQFRDRDYRLYLTICPPYMVKKENGPSTADWKYTDDAQDREFIDLLATISGETYHRLPSSNFKGFTVQGQPHFKNQNWGQGWNASQMGFWVWKYYNTHTVATNANGVNTTDAPLFRVGEVMVNYAEAMCELGKFDQTAADKSINKLRARGHVAKMTVEDITDDFDTARDPSVPALLWEVRRERRVELMGEGFRLDDLRRWKKGDYVNKRPLGVYVTGASAKNLKVTGGPSNDEGYVYFFDAPLGWQEHYYLYPLPLKQLALNTNLEQNPVWTK